MAEETAADETPITFNVKSSSDAKFVMTIPLTTTVLDLKTKLSTSDYADIPPDRQRLIYSGRVLKDADTLASYKIKEGNTVHLVKGAASNQRQNPANQSTSTSGSGAQPPSGVPANIAAGTGRDPLAALTGARYAGYAQMPNANMFGPDGGMGPPPDPEQMASLLENPNFASTLNEALSNPEVIEQMIRSNPMFQGPMGNQARQMLQDPNFRRMMTDPDTLRSMNQMRRLNPSLFGGMGGAGGGDQAFPMPGATNDTANTPTTNQQPGSTPQPPANPFAMYGQPGMGGAGEGAGNPLAALFGPGGMGGLGGMGGGAAASANPAAAGQDGRASSGEGSTAPSTGQQQQQQQPGANPISQLTQQMMQNPQMMQQILSSMGAAGAGGNSGVNPATAANNTTNPGANFNPFAALQAMGMGGGLGGGLGGGVPAPPQDDRSPEDRYAEQLRQLNDMGFYEFERNVEALRRTGGSVQGAVEYLLTH